MNRGINDADAMANSIIERLSNWKQKVCTASEEYKKSQEEYIRVFASQEKTTTETKIIITEHNNNNSNTNTNNNNKSVKQKKKSTTTTTTTTAVTTTLDCSTHNPMEVELAELRLFEAYNVLRITYEEYYQGCIQRQIPIISFIRFSGCDLCLRNLTWSCGHCTLENDRDNSVCIVCEARRPDTGNRDHNFYERPRLKDKFDQMFLRISQESKDFLKSSKKEYETRRMNMYRCLNRCKSNNNNNNNNNTNTFKGQQASVKDEHNKSSSTVYDDATGAVSASPTSGDRSNKRRRVGTDNGTNSTTTTSNSGREATRAITTTNGTNNTNTNANTEEGDDDDDDGDDDVTMLMFREAQVLSKIARGVEAIGTRTLKRFQVFTPSGNYGDISFHTRYSNENTDWRDKARGNAIIRFKNILEFLLKRQKIARALSGQHIGDKSNNNMNDDDFVVDRNNCERYCLVYNRIIEINLHRLFVLRLLRPHEQRQQQREQGRRPNIHRVRHRQRLQQQQQQEEGDVLIYVDHGRNNDNDNDNDNDNAVVNAENDDDNDNNIDNANNNNITALKQQLVRLFDEVTQAKVELVRAEQVLTANIRPCFQRRFDYNTNNNNDTDVQADGGDRDTDLDDNNNNNENDDDNDDDTNVAVVVDSDDDNDDNDNNDNDNENNGNEATRSLIGAYNTVKENIVQEEIAFTEEWNHKKEAMELNAYYNWFRGNNGVLLT